MLQTKHSYAHDRVGTLQVEDLGNWVKESLTERSGDMETHTEVFFVQMS